MSDQKIGNIEEMNWRDQMDEIKRDFSGRMLAHDFVRKFNEVTEGISKAQKETIMALFVETMEGIEGYGGRA